LKKLIDSNAPFVPAYAFYHHEQLGWLIGSFVVQCNSDGRKMLRHQRLLPENYAQFEHGLSKLDKELVQKLDDLNPQRIYNRFKGKSATQQVFFAKFEQHPNKEFALNHIEKRLSQIVAKLPTEGVYVMDKDGYPCGEALQNLGAVAEASFIFDRKEDGTTLYAVKVMIDEAEIMLRKEPTLLVSKNPPYLIVGNRLFSFKDPFDGTKLKPFLVKEQVTITPQHEEAFFKKFFLKLLEEHRVEATGFSIREVTIDPKFELKVERQMPDSVRFTMLVSYGSIRLPVNTSQAVMAMTDPYFKKERAFVRVVRNTRRERQIEKLLRELQGNRAVLNPFDFTMPEEQGMLWLTAHHDALAQANILVNQEFDGPRFTFGTPVLETQVVESDRVLHIAGLVRIGQQEIPFQALKEPVLKQKAEVELPDGSCFLLPEQWMHGFRHLFEVAETTPTGVQLRRDQAGVLETTAYEISQPAPTNGKSKKKADAPEPEPENPFHYRPKALEAFGQIETQKMPEGLNAELRDYQRAGFDWMNFLHDYGLSGILADDMGLGKTIQTLTLLLAEKEKGIKQPSLVILPTSLIFNWMEEAKRFTPSLKVMEYTGTRRTLLRRFFAQHDIILTTYGMVRQDIEELKQIPFHYVILDESQNIKNHDAKTTRAALQLQSEHRLSLTGTPIENSTMDLWSQINFLNPGLLGSRSFFEKFYAVPIEKQGNQARANQLRRLIRPLILRRTKQMVAKELPPRVDQVHYCAMEPAQQKLYDQTRRLFHKTFFQDNGGSDDGKGTNKLEILSSLQRLRQIAIHPAMVEPGINDSGKYDTMREMLMEIVSEGSKVLVFSQFVKLLTIIRKDLDQEGIPYAYIDGSVTKREAEVKKFQAQDDIQVFLISLKAGGTGLNLTAAEYVFLLDPWWNPAVELQAMNRAHRIGQDKTVFAYKFITRNSIEEKILQLQERKMNLAGDILPSETEFFKSLTREELEALFKD
jgi:hypothetical protein